MQISSLSDFETLETATVSLPQAAELLGTSQAELISLSRRKVLPPIKDRRFPFSILVRSYISWQRSGVVPIAEAASIIGVSRQWAEHLVREGAIPASRGLVRLHDAFLGYIRWLKDDQRRVVRVAADCELIAVRRAEIEMRMAVREKELIDTREAIHTLAVVVAIVRKEMSSLGKRVSPNDGLRVVIDAKVDEVFIQIDQALYEGQRLLLSGPPRRSRRSRVGRQPRR